MSLNGDTQSKHKTLFSSHKSNQIGTTKLNHNKCGGGELDFGLRPKGPRDRTLRDGSGPKMWIEVRTPEG